MVTDEDDDLTIRKPKDRHEFIGDGTDTCRTSKPPTHDKLREVFQRYQMTVIAILYLNSKQKTLDVVYENHFKKIGNSIPYCGRQGEPKSRGTPSIFSNQDLWSKEKPDAEELESLSNSLHAANISQRVKDDKYIQLIKSILECLGETRGCLFGDPEGFNTLGL